MSTEAVSGYGLIIDGLNCAAVTREQMQRTLAGGVTAINLTMLNARTNPREALIGLAAKLKQISSLADIASIATTTADILRAKEEGKVAIIMGAQNSNFIGEDVELLRVVHRAGMRIMQPTYNERNVFGDGATVEVDRGITELGRQWVELMHELRMVIDLSHCGYKTSADFIAAARTPIIFSHANALALCNSPRNKPDALIRAIAEKGGVTGAVTWAPALKHATRPTLDDYLDQVVYIANLAGIEHISIASDMAEGAYASPDAWDKSFGPNGMYPTVTGVLGSWYTYEQRFVEGIEGLAFMYRIWDGLRERGFSEDAIKKIMGGNLLRVFRENWGA